MYFPFFYYLPRPSAFHGFVASDDAQTSIVEASSTLEGRQTDGRMFGVGCFRGGTVVAV